MVDKLKRKMRRCEVLQMMRNRYKTSRRSIDGHSKERQMVLKIQMTTLAMVTAMMNQAMRRTLILSLSRTRSIHRTLSVCRCLAKPRKADVQ